MTKPKDLVQGTLDLLILKTVALEPMHGWAIAQRVARRAECSLPRSAQAGTTGLDQVGVETLRNKPPRKVLLAHARWAQSAS